MPRTQVVLNVHGGVVQDVFASDPEVEVILVDWDGEGVDTRSPNLVEVPQAGLSAMAFVVDLPVSALSELAGTDVERAIDIAYEQGILQECLDEVIC